MVMPPSTVKGGMSLPFSANFGVHMLDAQLIVHRLRDVGPLLVSELGNQTHQELVFLQIN
jgi:hypothetical protein